MSFQVTFVACWSKRSFPMSNTFKLFKEKRYYDGAVRVIACDKYPNLVDQTVRYKGELMSVAPYLKHTCQVKKQGKHYKLHPTHARFTIERMHPTYLTKLDMAFMYQEAMPSKTKSLDTFVRTHVVPDIRSGLYQVNEQGHIDVESLQSCELFERMFYNCVDWIRAPMEEAVIWYGARTSRSWIDTERVGKLNELKTASLEQAYKWLLRVPWKFCFDFYANQFSLKEITVTTYERMKRDSRIHTPPLIDAAVYMYDCIKYKRKQGDTIFHKDTTIRYFTQKYPQWSTHATTAIQFLITHKAVQEVAASPAYVAISEDQRAVDVIMEALDILRVNIQNNPQVTLRDTQHVLPCKPDFPLTEEQLKVVQHMYQYPLTMLESPGGCGKTECAIVWTAMQFARPLIVSTTGTAVDMISRRIGDHPGCAHTIAYIIACQKHVPNAEEWLSQYDTLIVDEASNVSLHTFAKLLKALSGLKRIILVGDGGQINPIEAGVPFRNFIKAFPMHSFRLTVCLRVDPKSVALAQSCMMIREGKARHICFGTQGSKKPLQLWDRPADTEEPQRFFEQHLKELIPNARSIMKTQFICMLHADRKKLNVAIEEAAVAQKVLKRPRDALVLYGTAAGRPLHVYPGQKLTFTQNRPATKKPKLCDGVRNGELIQVRRVKRNRDNSIEVETTKDKTILIGDTVKPKQGGVLKREVDAGWVITSNKSQGSEWDRSVFWIHKNPQTWMWTREYPYVAISRAKKQSIVIGKRQEFENMCAQTARVRNTLLAHHLSNSQNALSFVNDGIALEDPSVFDYSAYRVATKKMKQFFPQRPTQEPKKKKRKTKHP